MMTRVVRAGLALFLAAGALPGCKKDDAHERGPVERSVHAIEKEFLQPHLGSVKKCWTKVPDRFTSGPQTLRFTFGDKKSGHKTTLRFVEEADNTHPLGACILEKLSAYAADTVFTGVTPTLDVPVRFTNRETPKTARPRPKPKGQ